MSYDEKAFPLLKPSPTQQFVIFRKAEVR